MLTASTGWQLPRDDCVGSWSHSWRVGALGKLPEINTVSPGRFGLEVQYTDPMTQQCNGSSTVMTKKRVASIVHKPGSIEVCCSYRSRGSSLIIGNNNMLAKGCIVEITGIIDTYL